MDKLADLVVHRLSGYYSWTAVRKDNLQHADQAEQSPDLPLVILQLHEKDDKETRQRLLEIQQLLTAIQVQSWITELQKQASLLICCEDELAASCCLKNAGVAITTAYTENDSGNVEGNL